MSVPEGKMRLMNDRHEIWLVASILNALMAGKTPPQGLLRATQPVLNRMNNYLGATDGTPPAYDPSSTPQAGVG